MALHRHELENVLFTKGIEAFDAGMCVEVLHSCDPHELEGQGEL